MKEKEIAPEYFTLRQVASYLNVSYDLVVDLIQDRKLSYVPIGNRKLVRKTYLEKWLENKTVNEIA